jgi:serine protein kinase
VSLQTDTLHSIREQVRTRFESSRRVLSFEEYFEEASKDPLRALRTAPHYVLDAIHHFGTVEVDQRDQKIRRFRIFDAPWANGRPVVGQESVQNRLYQALTSFKRSGRVDKLLVVHGPNGSAKSSLIRTLLDGLEQYSQTDAGQIHHFSWVFPTDTYEKSTLGIGNKREAHDSDLSFARMDHSKVGAVLRCELHESPLALIPKEERHKIFESWSTRLRSDAERSELGQLRDAFMSLELSHKSALIYDALLTEYQGDYRKILRHIRVERLYLSRRFRRGLVSVEPQFGVDATLRQVTLDRSLANIPPVLQSLNLFQLEGDLVDGNRGLIEYNDFLKRPLEHFKYLLSTCETGSVNLSHVVAYLDCLFVATTDERHLEGFREHPEYPSFKSRLEFIKVPYLLSYSKEAKIYQETAQSSAGPKELMPHTTQILALWAVLSRLKRPLLKNKSSLLSSILEDLSPLQKAKLYDSGELPEKLNDEQRRELKGHIETLLEEQNSQPYYEGLLGPSARELKVVLQTAAQNDQFPTLGPNAVLTELQKLVRRPMDFEYLRLEPNHGYHAFEQLIEVARSEWIRLIDLEMRSTLGLSNTEHILDRLGNYVTNITAAIRGEKIKNRITGLHETADQGLMEEFEAQLSVSSEREEFRRNLISRLGAWSVENPALRGKPIPFERVFPDLVEKLQNHYFESQKAKIREMGHILVDINLFNSVRDGMADMSEAAQMALRTYKGLQKDFGYGPTGAKEALVELMKARYL